MTRIKSLPGWSTWGIRPESLSTLSTALTAPHVSAGHAPEAMLGGLKHEDQEPQGGVAVIPLRGLITPQASLISILFGGGSGSLMSFRHRLSQAVGSSDVEAIVLNIDSPGGSTQLLAETAAEIREARSSKPVVAVANTLAASAAYWLGSQAEEFVVTPSGEVGSIGVVAVHWDESGFNESNGFDPTIITSGKYKAEGNPYEPLGEEARAALQEVCDDYYDLFVADVAQGRRASVDQVRSGFGEGRVLTAKRAVAAGLADRIETIEQVIARVGDSGTTTTTASEGGTRTAAEDETPPVEDAPPVEDDSLEAPGTPPPNSPEEDTSEDDKEAAARTRRSMVDLLTT